MRTSSLVAEFQAANLARGLSPATIATYAHRLGILAREAPDLPTTPAELERVLGTQRHLAPESRVDLWRSWRRFYHWAHDRHPAIPLVAQALERPRTRNRLPKALSRAQITRLLALPLSRRDRAIITLALDTGARLGELHGLAWADVDDATGCVRLSGKTGERWIPVSKTARNLLAGLKLPWRSQHTTLTPGGIAQLITRALRRAGVNTGGPHTLRHTMARHYLLAGGDLVSLQRILGHARIETTRIYLEMDTRDLVDQHSKFGLFAVLGDAKEKTA
ncbi:MAG: tyrosine-type recombinase/integrase [Chloroflexota bacterium]